MVSLNLKKIHLIIVIILAVMGPIIAGLSAYYTTQAGLVQELHTIRLQAEKEYAKQADYQRLEEKLDKISADVAEIKGYIRRR